MCMCGERERAKERVRMYVSIVTMNVMMDKTRAAAESHLPVTFLMKPVLKCNQLWDRVPRSQQIIACSCINTTTTSISISTHCSHKIFHAACFGIPFT
jgi:hypothetical protein